MLTEMKSDEACTLSVEDLVRTLETDLNDGLSLYEVDVRKKIHGYNDFTLSEDTPIWKKYIEQVAGVVPDAVAILRATYPFTVQRSADRSPVGLCPNQRPSEAIR